MQLRSLIEKMEDLDEDDIICVRRPWSETAEAQAVQPDSDFGVPKDVKEEGFAYFLEVHIAKEVLEVLGTGPSTLSDQVTLLLHYAENDAYPDWAVDK